MKKIILLLFLFSSLSWSQITVAIADFKNTTDVFRLDAWENSIPEYLKSELSKSDNIVLVERRKLDHVLQEQALGLTGLMDSLKVKEVGKLLGAQYIINGSVSKSGKNIRIDANIIRVQSGQVRTEKVIAQNEDRLTVMMQLLGNNIRNVLAGEVKYKEKIVIKKYPTRPFLLSTLGLGITTMVLNGSYQKELKNYRDETSLSKFDERYDSANGLNKLRVLFTTMTGAALIGTVYCWIGNMSPEKIIAYEGNPGVYPVCYVNEEGNIIAGIQISF